MTTSDLPLASATATAGPDRARVSTRARARVGVTFGDVKALRRPGRIWQTVASDARGWWLVAAAPPSLSGWLASQSPAAKRIPDGNWLLRGLWLGHNWTFGVATTALSVVLFLAAAGLRWLGHPVRFWTAVAVASALVIWVAFA
jgi:hypothetical protein